MCICTMKANTTRTALVSEIPNMVDSNITQRNGIRTVMTPPPLKKNKKKWHNK